MGTLTQNLRYAVRALWNSPGFTMVVVLTLALGIGANTAIFSVVYSALLHPLPYRDPSKLFHLGESRSQSDNSANGAQASYPDYLDWKRAAKSIQSFAAYSGDAFTLSANGEPKNTFAALRIGQLLAQTGQRDDALKYLKIALGDSAKHPTVASEAEKTLKQMGAL